MCPRQHATARARPARPAAVPRRLASGPRAIPGDQGSQLPATSKPPVKHPVRSQEPQPPALSTTLHGPRIGAQKTPGPENGAREPAIVWVPPPLGEHNHSAGAHAREPGQVVRRQPDCPTAAAGTMEAIAPIAAAVRSRQGPSAGGLAGFASSSRFLPLMHCLSRATGCRFGGWRTTSRTRLELEPLGRGRCWRRFIGCCGGGLVGRSVDSAAEDEVDAWRRSDRCGRGSVPGVRGRRRLGVALPPPH